MIEIKPDSDGAKSEGNAQGDAYAKGIMNWYADKNQREALLSKHPKLAECATDDKAALRVEWKVYTYELCSSIVRDEFGNELKEASSDVSENAE